ncbi:MAG: hypothetical protein HY821_14735, partial [Acidobacteria bacterium]|nr:hypothetical protein [Acidobacteriota bacterium]
MGTRILAALLLTAFAALSQTTQPSFTGTVLRRQASYVVDQQCLSVGRTTAPITLGPTQTEIQIPSDFGCPAMRLDNGKFVFQVPAGPVEGRLNQANSPTAVVFETAPQIQATLSGDAFRSVTSESAQTYLDVAEIKGLAPEFPCATAVTKVQRTNTQPGSRIQMSAAAACQSRGWKISNVKVVNNQVTEFTATIETNGSFDMGHDVAYGQSGFRGGHYEVTVKTDYQFVPSDEVTIESSTPAAASRLDPLDSSEINARVRYKLLTRDNAWVNITARDDKGAQIGTGAARRVAKGEGTVQISGFFAVPRTAKFLRLNAVLLEQEFSRTALKTSMPSDFPVSAEMIVAHIEVNQAVQTADNEMPFIAGKPTAVRVYTAVTEATASEICGPEVWLYATREGAPVPGSPFRAPAGAIEDSAWYCAAKLAILGLPNSAHTFLLPPEALGVGTLALRAVVNPAGDNRINEKKYDDNEKTFTVQFVESGTLAVARFDYCFPAPEGPPACPTGAQWNAAVEQIGKLYPLDPRKVVDYGRLLPPFTEGPAITTVAQADDAIAQVTNHAQQLQLLSGSASPVQWVILLPGGSRFADESGPLSGLSDPVYAGGRGRAVILAEAGAADPAGYMIKVVPHELAHNLGLQHPSVANLACGPGTQMEDLGMDPVRQIFYFLDAFKLMAYCEPLMSWIDSEEYYGLYQSRFLPRSALRLPGARAATEPHARALLSGILRRDPPAATVEQVLTLTTTAEPPAAPAEATHCVLFFGDAGAVLGQSCFQFAFTVPATGAEAPERRFSFAPVLPPGTTRMVLFAGAQEVWSAAASANPPQLSLVSPQPGDVWQPGTQSVSWTASDADGDSLLFSVQASSDGGATWLPLATGLKNSRFDLDPAYLDGGKQVHLRVLATDGFHTATASAGPLELVQIPAIQAPDRFDFYNALIRVPRQLALPLASAGSGPLIIESATVTGPFTLESNFPMRIGARETAALQIALRPTTLGAQTGVL